MSSLCRGARQAGWTFDAEHWAIDADIPIVGTASFESDFKLAVRELVASTELADRPAQPCFYSNQVLRIVPYAQPCDRTVGATRPSCWRACVWPWRWHCAADCRHAPWVTGCISLPSLPRIPNHAYVKHT